MRAAGLIAAAGSSARMGRCKALLPFTAEATLAEHLAEVFTAAGLDPIVVTLPAGPDADLLAGRLARWPVQCRANVRPDDGLSGSVLTALLAAPEADALVLTPVDCPFATAELVGALLGALTRPGAAAAVPRVGERRGHPAAFARRAFEALGACAPRGGPRAVLAALGDAVVEVPWSDPRVTGDLDTPDDYERLFGRRLAG